MPDDHTDEDGGELTRYQCPNCGKVFDAAINKWESENLICPYCGAEVEN